MNSRHLLVKDLYHHYYQNNKRIFSLNSINLSLNKGELIGLIGPSGCGKTTLLRCIAGFENPDQGYISIDNQVVASKKLSVPPERRKVGMVFQDYALFPHLNAWQNVCFGINKTNEARAQWLLEILGLIDLRFRYPHELSGGQKQRLALARALAPGNSFVLLDEPFSSLDVEVRYRLRSELKVVLKTCSACGILVTHDPEEALAICDRVAVMKSGEIHQFSSPENLVEYPETSFVGRFALHRNVLPIVFSEGRMNTEIGSISTLDDVGPDIPSEVLIDEMSLSLTKSIKGSFIVEGREFLGNYWRIRIKINHILIRVFHSLESPPDIGDRCDLCFKKDKTGILFPGCRRITFS